MQEPARSEVSEAPEQSRSLPGALFGAWHRMIGAILLATVRAVAWLRNQAEAWLGQWRLAARYHRNASVPWSEEDTRARETAAAVGARAFLFGLALAAFVSVATRGLWMPAAVTVIAEVLWAAARFIILALLMPPGRTDRARLSVAFLAGLVPYVLGATSLLRLLALAASALLTYRGLAGAGIPPRDSRVACGWAFGGQAGVIAGGWVLRGVIVLLRGF